MGDIICLINPLSSVYANPEISVDQGVALKSFLHSPAYLANIIKYPILCGASSCVTEEVLALFNETNNPADLIRILKAYKFMLENTSSLSNIGSSVNIRYKKLSDALSLINASIQSLEELVFADLRSPIINVFLSLTFKTANEFVLEYFQEPSLSSQGFNNTRQDSKSRSTTADTVQTPVSPELTLEAALERFKIIYEKGQDVTTLEIQEFSSIFNILMDCAPKTGHKNEEIESGFRRV